MVAMKVYIGIDPGKSGSIAKIRDMYAEAWPMPDTERDLHDLISTLAFDDPFALIERVHAWPAEFEKDGKRMTRGIKSTFTFAQGYGFLRGILTALSIPFDEVSPKKWQTAMGCLSGGDKNVTKSKAQQLFPSIKVTHRIADGLLIAEYCRRIKSGQSHRSDPYENF